MKNRLYDGFSYISEWLALPRPHSGRLVANSLTGIHGCARVENK